MKKIISIFSAGRNSSWDAQERKGQQPFESFI